MRTEAKTVRQSVSLPASVASQVRTELIENGIEAERRRQQGFFDLAGRFRDETDPEAAKRLGDQSGRMVFGS